MTDADRELLEAAAKAAGVDGNWHERAHAYAAPTGWLMRNGLAWNPLIDDGAALRLAVTCKIDILQFSLLVRADVDGLPDVREPYNGDPLAATRRAIVRAAAELGRTK